MDLYAVSHPIDGDRFPTMAPGWRWAVYTSNDWADLGRCLGAGWAHDGNAAWHIANQASLIALRTFLALRPSGMFTRADVELDHDPIPAGADYMNEVHQ